jgi:hypothetical protein
MRRDRPRAARVCLPALESLEGRRLPAQFGVPWHHPDHLTLSFVPDGTSVAGAPSELFQTLDAQQSPAAWQQEILRTFQTWAVNADINFALTSDGGQPLGVPGPDQGDPRFGDIRIAAVPMASDVLSISVPHDPFLSGTWSGDILLNSAAPSIGQADTLFPVLLHEVGHVLGLDDSPDPTSVMFSNLNHQTALAPEDIAAVQALYGPRRDDPVEGPWSNDTLATSAPMPEPAGYDGTTPLLFYASISTLKDPNFYSLKTPAGYEGPLTIRLQTAGVSLLAPHLTVMDASGHVVGDVSSVTDTGDTLQVHLPYVRPGKSYFVEVRGATDDVFGIGEYVLAASFDARSTVGPGAIDTLARQSYSYLSPDDIRAIFVDPQHALFHVDAHTNDTFATAEPLPAAGIYGTEAPDRITASLSDATDVDVYRIETPDDPQGYGAADRPLVMTVTVRATEVNGIMPTVSVFDENGELIPAVVLAHGDGTDTIQITDDQPASDYYIRVNADPTSGKVVGNYDLDVEYGHVAAAPTTFLGSSPSGLGQTLSYDLVVNEPQFFDFLLAATAGAAAPGEAVRMVLTDDHGRIVESRTAQAGATAGGDPVPLNPGVYQASFAILGPSLPIGFRLYGASLTDPIGPALDNPTLRPVAVPTTGDPSVASLPVLGSASAPYYWLALELGGRGANGPGESQAPSTTLASAGLIPAQGLALAPADLATSSGLTARDQGVAGLFDIGVRSASARILTRYALAPPSVSATLVLFDTPARENPEAPQAEPPGNLPDVTWDALPVTLDGSPLALRPSSSSTPSVAVDERPPREADRDRPPAQPEPRAEYEGAGVQGDLAHVVAVLATAAVVYSRLLSGRSDDRSGPPVHPARVPVHFRTSRLPRSRDLCRV